MKVDSGVGTGEWSGSVRQAKLKILKTLQKLPKNVGDLGKIIVVTGFEKFPKVQLIAQSGHTEGDQ